MKVSTKGETCHAQAGAEFGEIDDDSEPQDARDGSESDEEGDEDDADDADDADEEGGGDWGDEGAKCGLSMKYVRIMFPAPGKLIPPAHGGPATDLPGFFGPLFMVLSFCFGE